MAAVKVDEVCSPSAFGFDCVACSLMLALHEKLPVWRRLPETNESNEWIANRKFHSHESST